MKKLVSTLLLSLLTTPGCFAAEKSTADFSKALTLTQELKAARQELAEASAIYEKETKKLATLDETTKKKIQACFSLTNEEAKAKAYAKDLKRGEYSHKEDLMKLEKELLEHHQNNIHSNREFFIFNNQKIMGEGHHLLFKVISDKHAYNRSFLSTVSSLRIRNEQNCKSKVLFKERDLALVMANFSSSDLEKFQKMIATIDAI